MSRKILLAALPLTLCACASGSPGREGSEAVGGGTLTVLSYQETYQPKSAYLTKFEIIGESAALLYPTRERDIQLTGPGNHRLPGLVPPFVKAQRDLYSPRATGLLNEAPRRIVDATVMAIASSEPLNLAPFLDSPSGMRNLLLAASANSEQLIIAEILRVVLPNATAVEWESDIRSVRIPESWAGGG